MVPAGEVHANQKTDCTFRCIFIGPRELQHAVEQFTERSTPALDFQKPLIDAGATTSQFVRMHRLLESPRSELHQDEALFAFLYELVVAHGTTKAVPLKDGDEDLAVKSVRGFLEEHYARPVRLRDLARLTGLSPYRLNRSFCRRIGMPPHAYQLRVRIARAKAFLLQGRSAAEAAALAGFFDQSHFTHYFKKSEGVTPRQYLRCCKNLQDGKTHTEYFVTHR